MGMIEDFKREKSPPFPLNVAKFLWNKSMAGTDFVESLRDKRTNARDFQSSRPLVNRDAQAKALYAAVERQVKKREEQRIRLEENKERMHNRFYGKERD